MIEGMEGMEGVEDLLEGVLLEGVDEEDESTLLEPPSPWTYNLPERFDVREEQDELADRIFELYKDGAQVVILQAPVGSGKSLVAELVRQKLEQWKRAWQPPTPEGMEEGGEETLVPMVYLAPYTQLQDQFCVVAETKILTSDLRWVKAGEIGVGDSLLGFDEERNPNRRMWRRSIVEKVDVIYKPCLRLYMEDGTVLTCSQDHRWLCRSSKKERTHWLEARRMRTVDTDGVGKHGHGASCILKVINVWENDLYDTRDMGYLAGVFDGEGYLHQSVSTSYGNYNGMDVNLSFAQNKNLLLDQATEALKRQGIPFIIDNGNKRDKCFRVYISGGRPRIIEALGKMRPPRLLDKFNPDMLGMVNPTIPIRVMRIEDAGTLPVIAIATSTKTFVAEGFASHNCESFPDAEKLKGKSHYPTPFESKATCTDCRDKQFCSWDGEDVGCEYRLARRTFCEADVGVTNVAYWLRAANYQRMFKGVMLPPEMQGRKRSSSSRTGDYLTVFDEVDQVENIALGFVRVEVVLEDLEGLAKIAREVLKCKVVVPKAPVRDQEGWMVWWWDALKVAKLVLKAARKLWGEEKSIKHSRFLKKAEGLVQKLERVDGDWVYNLQREMKGNRRTGGAEKVVLEPVKLGKMGQEMIWNHVGRALLMSGTVGSRQVLEDEVGLTGTGIRTEYVEVDSPWDWRRRPTFQMPGVEVTKAFRGKPWSEQPCFAGLLAHAKFVLERAWGECEGSRAVVHTVSHELARELGEALGDIYGRRVIVQRDGFMKDKCLAKYCDTPGSVILSASISRGVDLPGELCRDVLVAKVPWGNLGDKRIMRRRDEGPMGKLWYEVQALRDILQMLGRGMRCFSMDTEILTTSGWKNYESIEVGDIAYGIDPRAFGENSGRIIRHGSPQLIENPILAKTSKPPEPMIRVQAKGLDALVTRDHGMIIQKTKIKNYAANTKRDGKVYEYQQSYSLKSSSLVKLPAEDLPTRFKLPVSGRVVGRLGPRIQDEWFWLMGFIVADGHIHPSKNEISLFQAKPAVRDKVEEVLLKLGLSPRSYIDQGKDTLMSVRGGPVYTRNYDKKVWVLAGFEGARLRDIFWRGATRRHSKVKAYRQETHLASCKNFQGKYIVDGWKKVERNIPRWVLERASSKQMLLFLEGMMDGDGTWDKKGYSGHYYTKEKVIADRLQELLVINGYRSTVSIRKNEMYEVGFVKRGMVICTAGSVTEAPPEESWCVNTEYGTLVARRNGRTFLAGNSEKDWCRGWILDAQFRKLVSVRGLVPTYFERALRPVGNYLMPVRMRDFG